MGKNKNFKTNLLVLHGFNMYRMLLLLSVLLFANCSNLPIFTGITTPIIDVIQEPQTYKLGENEFYLWVGGEDYTKINTIEHVPASGEIPFILLFDTSIYANYSEEEKDAFYSNMLNGYNIVMDNFVKIGNAELSEKGYRKDKITVVVSDKLIVHNNTVGYHMTNDLDDTGEGNNCAVVFIDCNIDLINELTEIEEAALTMTHEVQHLTHAFKHDLVMGDITVKDHYAAVETVTETLSIAAEDLFLQKYFEMAYHPTYVNEFISEDFAKRYRDGDVTILYGLFGLKFWSYSARYMFHRYLTEYYGGTSWAKTIADVDPKDKRLDAIVNIVLNSTTVAWEDLYNGFVNALYSKDYYAFGFEEEIFNSNYTYYKTYNYARPREVGGLVPTFYYDLNHGQTVKIQKTTNGPDYKNFAFILNPERFGFYDLKYITHDSLYGNISSTSLGVVNTVPSLSKSSFKIPVSYFSSSTGRQFTPESNVIQGSTLDNNIEQENQEQEYQQNQQDQQAQQYQEQYLGELQESLLKKTIELERREMEQKNLSYKKYVLKDKTEFEKKELEKFNAAIAEANKTLAENRRILEEAIRVYDEYKAKVDNAKRPWYISESKWNAGIIEARTKLKTEKEKIDRAAKSILQCERNSSTRSRTVENTFEKNYLKKRKELGYVTANVDSKTRAVNKLKHVVSYELDKYNNINKD